MPIVKGKPENLRKFNMVTKALSEKNKFNLLKKVRRSAITLKYLLFAFGLTILATAGAYYQNWISEDFPVYLLLLASVILIAAGVSFFEIINIKKAMVSARKLVVTGILGKK